MERSKECWVVTDGRAGIENQALGLAEAVARETELVITKKTISVDAPWRSLPRFLWGDPFSKLSRERSLLRPPFPDLWIACGRLSIPFAMAVKERSPGTFTVQLQNPRARLSAFDLIIPPDHDGVSGDNVFSILGSPNRITLEKLQEDGAAFEPLVAHLPHPRVAVLVGGSNSVNKVNAAQSERFAKMLRDILDEGVGLLITTSRRTPPEIFDILAPFFERDDVFFWDGQDTTDMANPYIGMLSVADHVIVTEDSVNMATEAAVTGKPLHIHRWRQNGAREPSAKFDTFHRALEERGVSRPLTGMLGHWTFEPFDETRRAARELVSRWNHSNEARLRATFAAN